MGYTIATHNGSRCVRAHNIRDRRLTDKENHIDPDGIYEIWRDEKIRDAYDRIFGDAVREYNSRQTRADRKIDNYYNLIKNHEKKHPIYEMIISIGNMDHPPDPAVGKTIMREFVDTWKNRNPHLDLIGAYYHADESGVPHVHLDYIPVGNGYKRGLRVQNGLNRALDAQGFQSISSKQTAQMQWEKRENLVLEKICQEHGIDVIHPDIDGRMHIEKDLFIRMKEHEKAIISILQAVKHDIDRPVEPIAIIDEKKRLIGADEPKKAVFRYDEIMPVLERIPRTDAIRKLAAQIDAASERMEQATDDMAAIIGGVHDKINAELAQERAKNKSHMAEIERLKKMLYDERCKYLDAQNIIDQFNDLMGRYPNEFQSLKNAILKSMAHEKKRNRVPDLDDHEFNDYR